MTLHVIEIPHGGGYKLERHTDDGRKLLLESFVTQSMAQDALNYELRCQPFEAEGMTRSDAQACVDAELKHPELRKTAHGLPQELADAGYRIEFGDENTSEPLVGRWWWTLADDCSDADYPDAAAAIESAQAAYDDGYDIDEDDWSAAAAYFGIDPKYELPTPDEKRTHIANMARELEQRESAKALLREAVDGWPQFDTDEEVNGGDMVEWFGDFRARAKAALGITKGA